MKNNNYIQLLTKNLYSQLKMTIDKDKDIYFSSIQQPSKNQYNSNYIKDFLKFYLEDVKLTPSEFLNTLGTDKNLILNLIYSDIYSFINIRKEIYLNFKPILFSNLEDYKYCLSKCLKTHFSLKMEINSLKNKNNDNYLNSISQQITDNTILFKNLIEIGIEKKYFSHIEEEFLHTKDDDYKEILKNNNLIINSNFSEEIYLSLIHKYCDKRNKYNIDIDYEKLMEYQMHYLEDILIKFKNINNLKSFINLNFKSINSNGEDYFSFSIIEFIHLFLSENNNHSYIKKSNFFETCLKDLEIRTLICSNNKNINSLFEKYPQCFFSFIKNISDNEWENIYQTTNYSSLNFEEYYNYGNLINSMVNFIINPNINNNYQINEEDIIFIIDKFTKLKNNTNNETTQLFFSTIQLCLSDFFINEITNKNLTEKNYLSILKLNLNYSNNIIALINQSNKNLNKQIEPIKNIFLNIFKKSNHLFSNSEEVNILRESIQDKLKLLIQPNISLKNIDYYYNNNNTEINIKTFIFLIEGLHLPNTLEQINFENSFFTKKQNNNKYEKTPILLEILLQITKQETFNHILNEKNVSILNECNIGNKSIFYLTLKNNPRNAEIIIQSLKDKPIIFNNLILKKPLILKFLNSLNNQNINTIINFNKLQLKIINKNAKNAIINKPNTIKI